VESAIATALHHLGNYELRLATALFRRYLRARIPIGPNRTTPLAGARPKAALAETQRTGHHHH
jgi:hypothetical protein